MKTKVSIILVCLIWMASSMFAQENAGNDYAWRLDSITFDTPYDTVETASDLRYGYKGLRFDYSDSTLQELHYSYVFFPNTGMYYRLRPNTHKRIYSGFGEKGKHKMTDYQYSGSYRLEDLSAVVDSSKNIVDMLSYKDSLFEPDALYEYAYDTSSNIFDEEGYLIRQIRNYDVLMSVAGDSPGVWIPDSRRVRQETDSTSDYIRYWYDTGSQQWHEMNKSHERCTYRNHKLHTKEIIGNWIGGSGSQYINGTEYNENGAVVRTYDIWRTETGLENGKWYKGDRMTGKYNETNLAGGGVERTEEHYLSDGTTLKKIYKNAPTYKELKQVRIVKEKEYTLSLCRETLNAEGEMTGYLRSHYTYDEAYHCTMKVDSALTDGAYGITQTRYDANGGVDYLLHRVKYAQLPDWVTVKEETPEYSESATYYLTMTPIERYVTKEHKRKSFDNGYDYTRDKWNADKSAWETYAGEYRVTSLGMNDEPLSAISYNWSMGQWEPGNLYAFRYDTTLNLYARSLIGMMYVDNDGKPSVYSYNAPEEQFYTADGNIRGYYNTRNQDGRLNVFTYDSLGRIIREIEYDFGDQRVIEDTVDINEYTYFPDDESNSMARSLYLRKNNETGEWYVSSESKNSKTYYDYDASGIVLQARTIGWTDNSLGQTGVIRHNEVFYDGQGRLAERITYNTSAQNNVRDSKYRYLYKDDRDPTPYITLQWKNWSEEKQIWQNQSAAQYDDEFVEDEQGRVVERISYALNSDSTMAIPNKRILYYYEGTCEDWLTADTYTLQNGELACSGTESRQFTRQAEREAEGAIAGLTEYSAQCAGGFQPVKTWEYSYGASVEQEPVLAPSAFGLDELTFANGTLTIDFAPMASKRVKQVRYSNFGFSSNSYVATCHYTALREGLVENRMPVTIAAEKTSAVFTWGAVEGAESYVLHVYGDAAQTEEICYVVFDKTGKVISVNFVRHAPSRYGEVEQFNYTLDGLAEATAYWYTVTGCDADGKTIESTHGSFRTKGEGEDSESIGFIGENEDSTGVQKILRNGQIIIRRGEAEYTIQGNQIK